MKFCVSFQVSEGVEYSQKVVDMGESLPLASRGYLSLGIGYSLQSDEVHLQGQRQALRKKAVDAFYKSVFKCFSLYDVTLMFGGLYMTGESLLGSEITN